MAGLSEHDLVSSMSRYSWPGYISLDIWPGYLSSYQRRKGIEARLKGKRKRKEEK